MNDVTKDVIVSLKIDNLFVNILKLLSKRNKTALLVFQSSFRIMQ